MEMEGSIQEFSVPEILQFLSLHEADGVLKLKSGREEVDFGFKRGKITDALHKGEKLFHSISEYVQRTGLIPPDTFNKYMERAKEAGLSFLEIVEKGDFLSKKNIEEIIAFKIQETTCEVLTWNEGRYSFEAGKKLYQHSAFSVEIEPNTLVMEGIRRIDEWPLIEKALPDENITLRKLEKPEINVEIGEDEKTILEKITEDITLHELVGISGIGKFRTYNSVYKLTEIGLLEKGKGTGKIKTRKKTFAKKPRMAFPMNLKQILLYGFIIIHIIFLFKFRLNHVGENIRNIKNLLDDPSRVETILPLFSEDGK
ncbi:DUF4388 domain-containing protein [candidate division WOR-3 bacterium]|nr:DUF4388 domain-containing protein [candidate division WOR-3 bacterium]